MTVLIIEGFDYYPAVSGTAGLNTAWSASTVANLTLVAGRFGGLAVRGSGAGSVGRSLNRAIPSTTSAACGFALSLNGPPGLALYLAQFRSSGGVQCGLGIGTDGVLRVYGASTGVVLGAAAAALATGPLVWNFVEIEVELHDSTGAAGVWVNGQKVIDLSNVDTKGQSAADITEFAFLAPVPGPGSPGIVDDLYVTNGTRLGECRVVTLRPSADTADADWTPSTGVDHFAVVDETSVNGDTDYAASANAGDLELYNLGDLGFTPAGVFAVQCKICARKDDATTREVRTKIRSNGATNDGATVALTSSYAYYSDILETDPDTSAAWTAAAVDALEVGQEVVT